MAPERLEPFTSSSNDAFYQMSHCEVFFDSRDRTGSGQLRVCEQMHRHLGIELWSLACHARLNAKLRAPVITHQQSNIPKQISRKVFYWTDTVVVKFLLVYQLCVYQLGFIKLTLRYLRIFDQNRTISWHLDQHDIERYSAIFHQSNNKSGGVLK